MHYFYLTYHNLEVIVSTDRHNFFVYRALSARSPGGYDVFAVVQAGTKHKDFGKSCAVTGRGLTSSASKDPPLSTFEPHQWIKN